jgi:hypothetical protein
MSEQLANVKGRYGSWIQPVDATHYTVREPKECCI